MQCLIDKSVLNANIYYKKYLREPSPAGDITIGAQEINVVEGLDLQTVLSSMKTLGAKGEMLVVTHSNPKGLLMRLIKGGTVSAEFTVMEKILEIHKAIRSREAIDKAPKKFKAWQDWFKKFESGVNLPDDAESNDKWPDFVQQKFDEWFARQGKTILGLPNGQRDLGPFIQLVEDVRKTGFARLEFRACRIGTDAKAMKSIADFLNVPKEVRTFYGNLSSITKLSARDFAAKVKAQVDARKFSGINILMILTEHTMQAFAMDPDADGKAFVKAFIDANFTGGVSPFIIGGLEPTGSTLIPGKKHIFPLESEYNGLLAVFDAAKAAAPSTTP